jgi:hypothetical protein
VRNQNSEINWPSPSLAKEKNIPHFEMEEQIASQKQRRRNDSRNHARPMRGDASLRNQDAACEQQHGTGSVQSRIEGREEGVLLSDQAAGLILEKIECGD